MDLKFKPVEAEDIMEMTPLFCQRPNKTCDSVALDSFISVSYTHLTLPTKLEV